LGVGAARRGNARIRGLFRRLFFLYYDFALGEGIAGVPRWACADGIVVDHLAQTVNAARSGARIDTFLVDTRSV
jgi:hypothetical protein